MWVSLFCLALIAGIAFFQSIHGLMSSLIFCVLTILCLALAFAIYEQVAFDLLYQWKPDLALPIALAGCFSVPLILTRVGMDKLIQRSSLLPAMVDRVGGIVFGLITALLIVGVLITAIQMLPFGGSVLGFARFVQRPDTEDTAATESWTQDDEDENAKQMREGDDRDIWFSPDRFAVRFASMLSEGVFSGRQSFRDEHPDLMTEIGWAQTIDAGSLHLAKPGAIQVDPLRITDYIYDKSPPSRTNTQTEFDPIDPKPGHEFWVASITPNGDAEDSDGRHRFTLSQIRLLARDRNDVPVQYIPCAVRDTDEFDKHVRSSKRGRKQNSVIFELWKPSDDRNIEVIFEVPKGTQPQYIAYKTGARAEVTAPASDDIHYPDDGEDDDDDRPGDNDNSADNGNDNDSGDDSEPAASARPSRRRDSGSSPRGSRRSGDRVSGATTIEGTSFFSDRLPNDLTLTEYTGSEVEINSEALQAGQIVGVLAAQGQRDTSQHISRFEVPAGKKLLHLRVQELKARSTLGRALSFSVRTIRNYLVTDDTGQQHQMVGQYAIAFVDTDDMIEIQYAPEQIGSMGGLVGRFKEIKRRHLEDAKTEIVYLYLIDEGRQVVRFSTGSGANRAVDLSNDNLVAE
ncbi:MAG: CvpA family protein [bacterium]|nr:CvpA family protein [bacterium]